MDPHSRRSIWGLLRTQREGRTLVLTTHFLDEAEILSDRIAIMAEGALRCAGSPLFLKARLGCGYRLVLSKRPTGFTTDGLLECVREFEPAAEVSADERFYAEVIAHDRPPPLPPPLPDHLLTPAGRYLKGRRKRRAPLTWQRVRSHAVQVNLPSGSLEAFSGLFSALDPRMAELGVKDYGVTCTTLEDVFLRINQNNLDRLDRLRASNASMLAPPSAPPSAPPTPEVTRRADAAADATPTSTVARAAATSAAAAAASAAAAAASAAPPRARMRGGSSLGQWSALVTKRRLQAQRDVCATCCQLLFPVVLVFAALNLLSANLEDTGPRLMFGPREALPPGAATGRVPLIVPPASSAVDGGARLGMAGAGRDATRNLSACLEAQGWELDGSYAANTSSTFPSFGPSLSTLLLDAMWGAKAEGTTPDVPQAAFALTDTALPVPFLPHGPYVSTGTLMFQSKQMHALPTLLASLYDAQLRDTSGGSRTLTTASHPLPRTKTEQAEISIALSAFASILILVPFAFVAASFVTPHVRERETGSKQMQYVSGVGSVTYWCASWCWDLLLYGGVLVATLAVFLSMGRKEFTGTREVMLATAALLGCFGTAAIGFASVASFLFRTPSSALLLMIAFHFLSGFGLVIADVIFVIVGGSAYDVDKQLHSSVYTLFPAYCLGRGFIVLSTRSAFKQLPFGQLQSDPPLYGWSQLGAPLTFMACETIAAIVLTLVLQTLSSRPHLFLSLASALARRCPLRVQAVLPAALRACVADPPNTAAGPSPNEASEDESVVAERLAIDAAASADGADLSVVAPPGIVATGGGGGGDEATGDGGGANELVLRHLRKQYPGPRGKLAVRDLCLRVHAGECFGFLGVNGAGKSTTFAMLTGALAPTSGDATLRGLSILSSQDELRKLVGFCPQHDALEALLTPRETLRLYAHIKGVPSDAIEAEIDTLLRELDLGMFEAKRAGTLSGGNKRKLCVAIALIGAPQLVLLDEPSSGMDAASKRFLWAVIKRRTAACSTILTTHSMEECEALCGRIGVMVDGGFRCLGPIQSLKSRYGQGYKVDLRLRQPAMDPAAVVEVVAQGCPGTKLEESEPPLLTVMIPQRATLAAIFAHLAVVRERCGVLECSLSQCTLEQVFLMMASKGQARRASHELSE